MNKAFFSSLIPGTLLFGRFRIVRCIHARRGSGVFLCNDTSTQEEWRKKKGIKEKQVVLKVLCCEDTDPLCLERFYNEMLVSHRIKHPNVLACDEFFEEKVFSAFSMEYLGKGTLAQKMTSSRNLDYRFIIDILSQVCSGLQAIHSAGILHRDLKPENILIDGSSNAHIADFGIAVLGTSWQATPDEGIVGTVNYLCPEYISEGRYDQRSDIYALGLMAYEMVTGTLPFQVGSPFERLTARVKGDAVSPRQYRSDCPAGLELIIQNAIARDPAHRYQSAHEMQHAFDQLTKKRPKRSTSKSRVGSGKIIYASACSNV